MQKSIKLITKIVLLYLIFNFFVSLLRHNFIQEDNVLLNKECLLNTSLSFQAELYLGILLHATNLTALVYSTSLYSCARPRHAIKILCDILNVFV